MTAPAARVGMTEQELRDHVTRLTRALEEEREWRLRSAGTLLAAETRAHVAESEVTRLQAEVIRLQGYLLGETTTGVDLYLHKPGGVLGDVPLHVAARPDTERGTVETCSECALMLFDGSAVHRGGTTGPDGHHPWAVHDRCYVTFLTQLNARAGDQS